MKGFYVIEVVLDNGRIKELDDIPRSEEGVDLALKRAGYVRTSGWRGEIGGFRATLKSAE